MNTYQTAYHPPSVRALRRYNVNRGAGLAGLGNGAYLEEQDRQAELLRNRPALTPEQIEAQKVMYEKIRIKQNYLLKMNTQAPIAKLPLDAYQNQMRRAIMQADFEAFNVLMTISKFGWSADTPLGMYRFRVIDGKRIYKPFSDTDLARLFAYMSTAANRYGYNRFAEPGSTCDWNALLTMYVNKQIAARKQYPATDWRHVVEIYPGRYICQVYRPSTWVKIRAPVIAAVAIVAAIYLGPIVLSKITGAGAAEGGAAAAGAGATGVAEATATGIVGAGTKAGVVTAVTTKTAATAITVTQATTAASAIAGAVEAGTLLSKAKTAVDLINKARTIDALISGEMPPPPIGISGDSFTEWALDIAKAELADELTEQYGEHLTKKMRDKLIAAEEERLRAEIEAMQRELAGLVNEDDVMPSFELDPDVRAKILEMQAVERARKQNQTLVALAIGAGAIMVMS